MAPAPFLLVDAMTLSLAHESSVASVPMAPVHTESQNQPMVSFLHAVGPPGLAGPRMFMAKKATAVACRHTVPCPAYKAVQPSQSLDPS